MICNYVLFLYSSVSYIIAHVEYGRSGVVHWVLKNRRYQRVANFRQIIGAQHLSFLPLNSRSVKFLFNHILSLMKKIFR